MFPVCSATASCSTHSQISIQVGRSISSYWRVADVRCNVMDRVVPDFYNGHLKGLVLQQQPVKALYSEFLKHSDLSDFMHIINQCSFEKGLEKNQLELLLSSGNSPTFSVNESFTIGTGDIQFAESSGVEEKLMGFSKQLLDEADNFSKSSYPDSTITIDIVQDNPSLPSDALNVDRNSLSNAVGIVNETNKSIGDLINRGENVFNSSVNTVTSSVTSALDEAIKALDSVSSSLTSSVDRAGESASNKFIGLSGNLKEASGKLGMVTVDLLRNTIVVVEDTIAKGFSAAVYSYDSVKGLLPPEIQDTLNSSESKLAEAFRPVGAVVQQAYSALQELEGNLGLNPNDPIIPFFLFLGASATLWGSYWIFNYGGYAGDLSPRSTLDILKGRESAALIDIRPEDLRERDGIPDLRRAARFRYNSVTLPEVHSTLGKLLKRGRDLDDMLIAAVIRNLKIVQDRSKVIILDADGSRSKGIARSLRKLGIKNSYLVQGGFQSWVKDGLRIKELRPETALVILNEEAEAIIEDINPTPLGIIGYGTTIYQRVASYEDSKDLKQDLRLLLVPVKLGGQAISWAAGKLETNRNGLPTIPSSSDVQSRVLQAAAKHESQPSDTEETKDPPSELAAAATNENIDLSEA